MASETLAPDTLASSSDYTGPAVTDIDDDPDSPDGLWFAWDGNGNPTARVTFPTPSGDPTTGAGLQEFRVLLRKTASGGNSTSYTIDLYENGVFVATLATGTITSTSGTVVSATWNASSLGTADGSLVECYVAQTSGGTGSPSGRRGIEVGAIEWNCDYTPASTPVDLDGIASALSMGSPQANHGLTMDGVASAQSIGTPSATLGVAVDGLANAQAFGTPQANLSATAGGIASAVVFGTMAVSGGASTNIVYMVESFDDGVTWTSQVAIFTGAEYPVVSRAPHCTLYAAFFAADDSIRVRRRDIGSPTLTAATQIKDESGGSNLTFEQEAFDISYSNDLLARWVLVGKEKGQTNLDEWYSFDDGATWKKVV